jgi:hypothetical protein
MTPKEKAKELMNKFVVLTDSHHTKQCALICVEEILSHVPYHNNDQALWIINEQTADYWQQVKTEIEKL